MELCPEGHSYEEWGRHKNGKCKACMKDISLRRLYGICLEEFMALYKAQGGKCAICNRPLRWKVSSEANGRANVDHDHDKRFLLKGQIRYSVRGLLCGGKWRGCNWLLGRFEHRPGASDWLRRAASYLDSPPAQKILGKEILVPEYSKNR